MNMPHHPGQEGQSLDEVVNVEVEVADRVETFVVPAAGEIMLVEVIRAKFENGAELHFFERDSEEPFTHHGHGRKHVRLVGHPCREVTLTVQYDHQTKPHHFKPSATVFKALQWAVSKHGYNLDPMQAAKANLILPCVFR
ncbi:MAG: hypothetical protein KGJ79_08180 [Alphaproteobacteria bacterium]|nr:hypothetical protein [Alphaproteobacteria bacterium]MDE2495924.1 hypothetical protein [Alphaproteobacteria bacterium]